MKSLFVCTGNICRSPIAERLTHFYAAQMGVGGVAASSAGTQALVGHAIHPDAAAVLTQLGGEIDGFAARQLSQKVVADQDLVLTMTRAQREAVLRLAPRLVRRTFVLIEFVKLYEKIGAVTIEDFADNRHQLGDQTTIDITDPIRQPRVVFDTVGRQISDLVKAYVDYCGRIA